MARHGWEGLERRHWEYRRAQNVAHPEGRNMHFVEDVGATIIFRGVGLVLGAGDAALHPAQTAENLAWMPARAIDAALVAENTPARVHLRNLGNNIANADSIDWAQFTGNTIFNVGTLAVPAARFARAGELAPVAGAANLDLRLTLQGVTDRAVADLAVNPGLARDLMSRGSYDHLVNGTRLADASYGKAVERLTARYVRDDPALSAMFSYQSRPFVSTPDFLGYEGMNTHLLDITTARAIPIHQLRSYGSYTHYVTHPGLPTGLRFTQR